MSGKADSAPLRFPWPPLVMLAALAIGAVLHFFLPLPWFGSPLSDILTAVGFLLVLAAIAIEITVLMTMHRARTTIRPDRRARHLVTRGPFAFSRNPIYLGNATLIFGIGLLTGIVWFLPLAFLDAWATRKIAIEPEERHLEERFGKAYRGYAKKVRRWI